MNKKPTLCVVAGPNGSGKTTTTVQLLNAAKAITFVDRAYVYDNSFDGELPRLLYRTTDGKLFKQYKEDIPSWAATLLE